MSRSILNGLLDEIEDLKKAKGLLGEIYAEVGPYGNGRISDQLLYRINYYFKFDDSE